MFQSEHLNLGCQYIRNKQEVVRYSFLMPGLFTGFSKKILYGNRQFQLTYYWEDSHLK